MAECDMFCTVHVWSMILLPSPERHILVQVLLPPDTFLEFTRLITSDLSKDPAFSIKVGVFHEYYTAMILVEEQPAEGNFDTFVSSLFLSFYVAFTWMSVARQRIRFELELELELGCICMMCIKWNYGSHAFKGHA